MELTTWPFSPVTSYYLLMSVVGTLAMMVDKKKAVKKQWRVSEKILMGIAALGGAVGIVVGMILFRHKTNKPLFYIGAPLLYAVHRLMVSPLLTRLLIDVGFVW